MFKLYLIKDFFLFILGLSNSQERTIIKDYFLFILGLSNSEERKHRAFKILLPPSSLEGYKSAPTSWLENLDHILPPKVSPNTLAMTTVSEQAYCQWYTSSLFSGQGEIVELGCWLGSLTLSLARGLKRNKKIATPLKVITVFDYFKWDEIMEDYVAGTPLQGQLSVGQSYYEAYKEQIIDIIDLIKINQADLTSAEWTDDKIEFLVIDAMKSMSLARNIIKAFFGSLIPNVSYVFHQDYLHFFHGWIHMAMFQLRDYFDPIYEVQNSTTVIFKCKKQIPLSSLEFPDSVEAFSNGMINEAFDWNISLVTPTVQHKVAAAKTMLYFHKRDIEEAKRLYRYYTSGPYRDSDEFKTMNVFIKRYNFPGLDED